MAREPRAAWQSEATSMHRRFNARELPVLWFCLLLGVCGVCLAFADAGAAVLLHG